MLIDSKKWRSARTAVSALNCTFFILLCSLSLLSVASDVMVSVYLEGNGSQSYLTEMASFTC